MFERERQREKEGERERQREKEGERERLGVETCAQMLFKRQGAASVQRWIAAVATIAAGSSTSSHAGVVVANNQVSTFVSRCAYMSVSACVCVLMCVCVLTCVSLHSCVSWCAKIHGGGKLACNTRGTQFVRHTACETRGTQPLRQLVRREAHSPLLRSCLPRQQWPSDALRETQEATVSLTQVRV